MYNNSRLISGVNCNAQRAVKDFISTKEQFNKTNGVQFYYAVQSFDENDNLSPALAHQIGIEWTQECYPNFEAVVCTHLDTDRHLDADGSSNLISGSIRFMGNLANLLTNPKKKFRGKRIKLSKKEIEKRLAHGQKTSGYEEYEDNNYSISM